MFNRSIKAPHQVHFPKSRLLQPHLRHPRRQHHNHQRQHHNQQALNNMNGNILEKKMPTFVGIFILIAGLVVLSTLVKTGTVFTSRASQDDSPKDVQISNISDTSFTVSYVTTTSVPGEVSMTKDNGTQTLILDDRDKQIEKSNPYKAHFITMQNLQPATPYSFSILSNQQIFTNDGKSFTVTTASAIQSVSSEEKVIKGSVIFPTDVSEGIVYLKKNTSQTLSALLKTDGTYSIDLQHLRTNDLSSSISIFPSDMLTLQIDGPNSTSRVSIIESQANPVPAVILSKDYDFTNSTNPLTETQTQSQFPTIVTTTTLPTGNPQIIVPNTNEEFSDQKPLFKGTASPGASVKVIIHSPTEIQGDAKADANGTWVYQPPDNLPPGQHTISITAPDQSGVLKTITQSFTVFAAGTEVNQSATPSATPIVVTPIPTIPVATIAPSIPPVVVITPTPPGSSLVETIGLGAFAAISVGLLLFFISQKTASSL